MKRIMILTILTVATIVAGFILAIFAYACRSFTCLVICLGCFTLSAYYATVLDDATGDKRKGS